MRRNQLDRARREAPEIVSLLEELETQKAYVTDVKAAWEEVLRLTDEWISAGQAAEVLGVVGPNVYSELCSQEAIDLFGPTTREDGIAVPLMETRGGGRQYRRRDIEALAVARRPGRITTGSTTHHKRKARPKPNPEPEPVRSEAV